MTRFIRIAAACAAALLLEARASAADGVDQVPLLSKSILFLKDNHLDPQRFDPKRMVVAAAERLTREVDELIVEGGAEGPTLTLRMGAKVHEVDLTAVTSIWGIPRALGPALEFVRQRTPMDPVDLELAALNGMLSTLDPHTTALGPKASRELMLQFRGETAGVGLVVGFRKGQLTVLEVLRGEEAERVGIRKGDVLRRIDGRSTTGLDLQTVVDRLRGPDGSEVALEWVTPGEPPRSATARRRPVVIQAVSSKLLAGDVVYVRMDEFTGAAPRDLARALKVHGAQTPEGLRGVILDLRGNPGGLVEAAQRIADAFLSSGTITDVVDGRGKATQTMTAEASPSDVRAPVVVLVDGRSAGASEIVAAALRENGRAIVVGRRTAGMGVIQQVMRLDDEDGALLKIPVAARRTADGHRLDGVGIEPDVRVRPSCITQRSVNVFAPSPAGADADAAVPVGDLIDLVDEWRLDRAALSTDPTSCEPLVDEDRPAEDPVVGFAAEVLRRAPSADREGLLAAAAAILPGREVSEQRRINERIASLGIDWTPGMTAAPEANVVVAARLTDGTIAAGGEVPWTVTVENRGPGTLSQLRAVAAAPTAPFLDGRELVFGTIRPGGKRSYTLWLRLKGTDATPRRDDVTLRLEERNGVAPDVVNVRFEIRKVLRPRLAWRAQLGCSGAKCPRLGAGADVKVAVSVVNARREPLRAGTKLAGVAGAGPLWNVTVQLEPLDERIDVTEGWQELGPVAPGAQPQSPLRFRVVEGDGDERLRFRVAAFTDDERTACELDPAMGARSPLARECRGPVIQLSPDPDAGVVVASGDRFPLQGTVSLDGSGPDALRSVKVFLNGRKVLYRAADDGARRLPFSTELRLAPGENVVVVEAQTRTGNVSARPMRIYQ